MNIHTMHLNYKNFNSIKQWSKIIELRLFDKKRQGIKVWDKILFVNNDDKNQTIIKVVLWILIYKNFEQILNEYKIEYFWANNIKSALKWLYKLYTKEDEERYGIVWIRLSSDI